MFPPESICYHPNLNCGPTIIKPCYLINPEGVNNLLVYYGCLPSTRDAVSATTSYTLKTQVAVALI